MTRVISDADFAALAGYLAREAGLVFDASRRPGLTSMVSERLNSAGIDDVSQYLAFVARTDGAIERQRLLDAVTIQETHFFRDGAQIEALRKQVLPDLLRRAAADRRPMRIWSAGCSTGEEPYTIAMLALEVRAALRLDVEIEIVGSDVSSAAVEVAEVATYAGRTIDLAEDGAIARWFDAAAGDPGTYRVKDEVRAHVTFRVHNLVTDPLPFPSGSLDLVVCRNVTIYFARDTTRTLVERFHAVLRPGGFLVLGHAETLWQVSDAFDLVPVAEAFAYRKAALIPPAGTVVTVEAPGSAPQPVRPARRPRPRTITRSAQSRSRRAADPLLSAATAAIERSAPHRERSSGTDALIAAREAWAEGRYAKVVELARRAVQADPMLVDAYVLGGQASSTLGDDAAALDVLRKAVFLEPSAGHAHFLLAGALSRLGQPGPAARSFRAAAATLPLVSPEQARFLLDGRHVAELVALCDQLADASERAASAPGRSTR